MTSFHDERQSPLVVRIHRGRSRVRESRKWKVESGRTATTGRVSVVSGTLLGAVILVTAVATLSAQTPRDTGVTLIHASRVFDSEHGAMTGPEDILVRHGKIDFIVTHLAPP